MKILIAITCLLSIFSFPLWESGYFQSSSFSIANRLPPNNDKYTVVWEGEMNTTRYSAIDSCHYEGCPTAMGIRPTSETVACPRNWKLGSIIEVDGQIYICHDRYNADLPDRIDIWTGWDKEAHTEALNYGNKIKNVKLLALTK